MENSKGICPIRDGAPVLFASNEKAVQIFSQARQSAEQITTEDAAGYKTHFMVKPTEISALMDMHQVPSGDRIELMNHVLVLQAEANKREPHRSKKKS